MQVSHEESLANHFACGQNTQPLALVHKKLRSVGDQDVRMIEQQNHPPHQ